ncbi:DUF6069 family protein [Streptomyces sp. NBC_01216]|uniref:DUF6069 family protein n=1 Tax=unclassified Streptomyces TaxID=2593676 RepID=UPI002E127FE8|nr:DUF6069 family protein [Streptomyces sp. NBC_01216]
MNTTSSPQSPTRVRALAVVAAVVVDSLIWLLAHSALDIDLRIPDGPGTTTSSPLYLPAVVIGSGVVALLGWGLLSLLEKFTAGRARTVWTVVALVVLALSLFAPLFGAGLTTGNKITLVLLHLTVGAILVPAFRRSTATA